MPFEPGHPKYGGRKEGSLNKDTRDFLNFQEWFGRVAADLDEIQEPEKRIQVELQVIDRLLSKVQTLPGTPGESLRNAEETLRKLKEMESAPMEEKK